MLSKQLLHHQQSQAVASNCGDHRQLPSADKGFYSSPLYSLATESIQLIQCWIEFFIPKVYTEPITMQRKSSTICVVKQE